MAHGVRKVYEGILRDGRAIIVTDKNKNNYDWADIPDGSKFIDTETGFEYVKLEGQSDWVPSYIKNDGTISIAKDAIIETETFFVKEILENELICETETGDIRHFMKDEDGFFVIEIENGTYPMGRNYLSVFINDIFLRTQENKGIFEVTPSRFKLLEKPALNMKITAKYYRTIRIGNPYPRIFMNDEDPGIENAEEGDIWIDTNAVIDPEGNINIEDFESGKIPWSMITGTPTSLQGYHINDKVSLQGHLHTTSDIVNFPKSMPASGGRAETAERLENARTINGVRFDGSENINIPVGVMKINGITPDESGSINIASLPIGFEYYSINPNVPPGTLPLLGGTYSRKAYKDLWAWIQSQKGFLITESEWQSKSTTNEGNVPFYSDGDGSTTFRVPSIQCWAKGAVTTAEIGNYLKAGLPNITGAFEGNINDEDLFSGAFYEKSTNSTGGDGGKGGGLIGFNASRSNPIYGTASTVQPKSIIGIWLVKAFGAVTNLGSQDLADISSTFSDIETRVSNAVDMEKKTAAYITKTFRNGEKWYRKYSDGWIEQGGRLPKFSSEGEEVTVNLNMKFSTVNYTVLITQDYTRLGGDAGTTLLKSRSLDSFVAKTNDEGLDGVDNISGCWYACGY